MISVKFDPRLVLPSIEVPITREPVSGEDNNYQDRQQSKFDGIVAPLIKLNDYTVDPSQIMEMDLSLNNVPSIYVVISDTAGYFSTMSGPDKDCNIVLQILPRHENTYKKIHLSFRCTQIRIDGIRVIIKGVYSIPNCNWHETFMKPYGKISSYELFESIANMYQLGFASNISNTDDSRWIYNPNLNVIDFLNKEIQYSGSSRSTQHRQDPHVFEWWIDFRNYLHFIDMYQEYNDVIPDDSDYMHIWMDSKLNSISSDSIDVPEKTVAMFTNNPVMQLSELFMGSGYTPESFTTDTDLNYEVFHMETLDNASTLIVDGDVDKNITSKYIYGGEVFGDYDYLTRKACRNIFLSKIYGNVINVPIDAPLLSLHKGYKVNVYWYDANQPFSSDIQEFNNNTLDSNIPLPDSIIYQDAKYIINKTYSGQYTILGERLRYTQGGIWNHTYKLSRPASKIQKIK